MTTQLEMRERLDEMTDIISLRGWSYRTALVLKKKWECTESTVYNVRKRWIKEVKTAASDISTKHLRREMILRLDTLIGIATKRGQLGAAFGGMRLLAEITGIRVPLEVQLTVTTATGRALDERWRASNDDEPDDALALPAPKKKRQSR